MIKRPILQEEIIFNVHAPNNSIKICEAKSDRIANFSILLSKLDRSSRKKISKNIAKLNSTVIHLDIIDIQTTCPPAAANIFFSSSHGTFTKRNYILAHKTHIKFKRIEIIQCPLSDCKVLNQKSVTERSLENLRILGDLTTHL